MSPRRQGRELAIKFLYGWELNPIEKEKILSYLLEDNGGKEDSAFVFGALLLSGVLQHIVDIDNKIQQYLKKWSIDRLAKVDLSILRLAVYELIYQNDTPAPVVINEAVSISKDYCSDNAYKFINGVLEAVAEEKKDENEKSSRNKK